MTISIANKKITIIELENYASTYESEDYSIILYGSFYRGSKRVDAGELLFLYKKYGKRTYKHLDGCGLLVAIDHKKECVICFSDYFNSNNFLFYKKTKSEIIISTSIFNLIGETYSFNKNAVKKFLEQGYVEGKITTINGIKKMMPFHYLFIDYSLNVVLQKKCFYHFKNTFVSNETYNATIKNCVSECAQMDKFHKGCSCTLSAGYDSNYLLFWLRNTTIGHIDAFSIGGSKGKDETKVANNIASKYRDVSCNTAFVTPNTLQQLPEIVTALSGQIYEQGVFLQYELGKKLMLMGVPSIILGECADQICRFETYHEGVLLKFVRNVYSIISGKGRFPGPYNFASNIILKKNGMMLSHFNVIPEYPYIRLPFIIQAKSMSNIRDRKKTYHKQVIKSTLPTSIIHQLYKSGGTTDLDSLFSENHILGRILEIVNHSRWNTFYNRHNEGELNFGDFDLKVLYMIVFQYIIERKAWGTNNYPTLNKILSDLLP